MVEERVPIPGVYILMSSQLMGISDYKHTPSHLNRQGNLDKLGNSKEIQP